MRCSYLFCNFELFKWLRGSGESQAQCKATSSKSEASTNTQHRGQPIATNQHLKGLRHGPASALELLPTLVSVKSQEPKRKGDFLEH